MNILVVAATAFEYKGLEKIWPQGSYTSTFTLEYLETGVGTALTAMLLTEKILQEKPSLILNIGLGGALDLNLNLGDVIHITSDSFGDLGVEQSDGTFTSVYELGLQDPDGSVFTKGKLVAASDMKFISQGSGVTVSTVHGNATSIEHFKKRCDAQVESMEGAAAMMVALRYQIPIIQLRAISNYVESRNREAWEIEKALTQLTEVLDHLLSSFPGAVQARSAKLQLGL